MQLQYEEIQSEWQAPPEPSYGGLPVSEEEYIQNVRDNCLLDLPNLEIQKEHDLIMVMVCGGPTAKDHLEEIRQKRNDPKYRIFCSNRTHDWLIENGIVPHYQFIIDPKKEKIKDVQNPHPDVKYLIGISCSPLVFDALKGYDVTRVFSVSGIGEPKDTDIIRVLFPIKKPALLSGGSMAGLRAMCLADIMGYQTVEFYGFDSCYFETREDGEPIYYSYTKRRKENILEAQTDDGRIFLTSPVFASQARQFIKWKHRLEWIKFIIHGDSLTAAINKSDDEKTKPKHDLLITEYSKQLNKEMHSKEHQEGEPKYGSTGYSYAGNVSVIVGSLLKKYGPITMLDYGCGRQTLEEYMPPIEGLTIKLYDPCIDGLDEAPEPADLVVCTDVLEHVEEECLENVLDDLKRVTKKLAYVAICLRQAKKSYSDGSNAHRIIESGEWWIPKLKKRFYVTETQLVRGDTLTAILQAKDVR